ncbi:hypothetical protein [Mesorhizobium sp. LSJC264A00]|uniref:hypothetical protein n=1 Tax=unclassified Mesorhizobium TaxID=325217 RepID=UPI000422130A|nr:hypothetical protein [Mesorhizobium sp. LSJC264A00]
MTYKPASAAHAQGDVGLNGALSDYSSAMYDTTVCYGVFTLGHVRPDALRTARVTRAHRIHHRKHPQELCGGHIL